MPFLKLLLNSTLLLLLVLPSISGQRPLKGRREVISKHHGVVATDHGTCSRIGMRVLRSGGHAIDAAVAAALCLGVVSPASSGIGGGAFMLFRLADGTTQAYDMRETAPFAASENMYAGNASLKARGALSVAIPGEVAGLFKAWKKYGKVPWKHLVLPSEKLARTGFKIEPYLRMQMERSESAIFADKGLRTIFASNGKLLKIGDICTNKKLADTLSKIAKRGPKIFYNGSVGYDIVKDLKNAGGILTMEDLRSYEVKIRKPLVTNIFGHEMLGMPPPSSGGASMMLILNILAQYQLPSGVSGSLGIHRKIEALKHAFAVRMNLGDPDFANVTEVVSAMLSIKLAKELKKTIDDNTTFDSRHYGGRWNQINDHGTSHVSIVDSERNAVSMTSTVNSYFGSSILSTSTGIVLNNEMDDFSMPLKTTSNNDFPPPAPANFVRPGKRPLSSMSPTIILKNGKLRAVAGASGGAMIIAGTTEVLVNFFIHKLDPFSSVMAPRFYHQLIPNKVFYEDWTSVTGDNFLVPADMRVALQKKGHVLANLTGGTVCQFIVQDFKGKLIGVSDPRKGGSPSGY